MGTAINPVHGITLSVKMEINNSADQIVQEINKSEEEINKSEEEIHNHVGAIHNHAEEIKEVVIRLAVDHRRRMVRFIIWLFIHFFIELND